MTNKLELERARDRLLLPGHLQSYLDTFIKELSEKGYTNLTLQGYYGSISHFGTWLQKKDILLEGINNRIVANFAKHSCHCSPSCRNRKVSRKYVARIQRFIDCLRQQTIIAPELNRPKTQFLPYLEKFKESLQSRGLAPSTITHYSYSISTLLPLLGDSPKKYNAILIRQVICEAAKHKSRCEIKKLTTALRAYLRFLTTEKACRVDLDAAVPAIAEWKLSSLPKYITEQEVERTIASCDIHTQLGVRDRAIILLLSRLGLRAGDVSNMRIDDINWTEGTIRVCGKGRRETRLPLPQEVGDALLTYLEKERPHIAINKLFLCLNAPYRPFSTSSGISSVVSAALKHAGIEHPPSRGASLLRHSAATNMLRKGATLETVSSVLRHRSLDMTGYYAKVDVPRLRQIAQPWPEGAPC